MNEQSLPLPLTRRRERMTEVLLLLLPCRRCMDAEARAAEASSYDSLDSMHQWISGYIGSPDGLLLQSQQQRLLQQQDTREAADKKQETAADRDRKDGEERLGFSTTSVSSLFFFSHHHPLDLLTRAT